MQVHFAPRTTRLVLDEITSVAELSVTHIDNWESSLLLLHAFLYYRDLNLDTKLELLRSREYMEYTFHTHPIHKDGKYRGQWRDAMPHGRSEGATFYCAV